MRTRDFALVVLAATLWGGGGVLGILLREHSGIHPLSVAMVRVLIAGAALTGYLAIRRELRWRGVSAPMWRRILLTGALTAAFEALFFTAITLSSVGLTTLIGIGSAPVFVALFDWLARGERPAPRTLIALALALVGLVLLLSGSLGLGSGGFWGATLALGDGAAFAAITIINRAPLQGLGPVTLTALAFAAGGLMLVPVAAFAGIGIPGDAAGWALAMVLGVVVTGFAYIAYLSGLATVPPFVATIVTLLEPLIAAVLGAVVLAERLGWLAILGGAFLGAAVVLLRPQRDEPESIH